MGAEEKKLKNEQVSDSLFCFSFLCFSLSLSSLLESAANVQPVAVRPPSLSLSSLASCFSETQRKNRALLDFLLLFHAHHQPNETILFPALVFFPFHPPPNNSAAATLRPAPRPFLLAGVFKSEEGTAAEGAGRTAAGGASNPTSTSSGGAEATASSSSPSPADGVAAAAAAVLSLSPGATLGSVSDAAICSSALWPKEDLADENEDEKGEKEKEDEEEEDRLDEWLARHTVDFLDAAALLQGALSHQFCTPETCPAMRAGPRHEYLWAEPEIPGGGGGGGGGGREGGGGRGEGGEAPSSSSSAAPPRSKKATAAAKKKPHRLPARDYASALFAWADALLACPAAFPQARGEPFPPGFRTEILQPLYRRLARVFAHLYFAHWREVADFSVLNAAAHLNTVFKHYVAFGREHGLLPEGELDPVRPLVEALLPPPTAAKAEKRGGGERPAQLPPLEGKEIKGKGARVEVSASSAAAVA